MHRRQRTPWAQKYWHDILLRTVIIYLIQSSFSCDERVIVPVNHAEQRKRMFGKQSHWPWPSPTSCRRPDLVPHHQTVWQLQEAQLAQKLGHVSKQWSAGVRRDKDGYRSRRERAYMEFEVERRKQGCAERRRKNVVGKHSWKENAERDRGKPSAFKRVKHKWEKQEGAPGRQVSKLKATGACYNRSREREDLRGHISVWSACCWKSVIRMPLHTTGVWGSARARLACILHTDNHV